MHFLIDFPINFLYFILATPSSIETTMGSMFFLIQVTKKRRRFRVLGTTYVYTFLENMQIILEYYKILKRSINSTYLVPVQLLLSQATAA